MARKFMKLPPKPCVICGVAFGRRLGEKTRNFVDRVTCGRPCRDKLALQNRKPRDLPDLYCLWCDNVLEGRKKSYCCRQCVDNHKHARAEARHGLKPKNPQWPVGVSFAGQNIEDEPALGRIWLPPIAISIAGSSAGYAVDRGESDVKHDIKNDPQPAKKGSHYVRSMRNDHHAL